MSTSKQIYTNVMEILVKEQINKQIKFYPTKVVQYINPLEVATYALNRLPALYASSKEGLAKQKQKAEQDLKEQIQAAVRQGFAAVQRDLLRNYTPLLSEKDPELQAAEKALNQLVDFFPQKQVSWHKLIETIEPMLRELERQKTRENNVETYDWDNFLYTK